ncbi:uncharacterized protein HD556DRAFT_1525052 [Suillus plorans]|uniref:DUF6533 domain-containing protein n=1 Tax=Suillus plorans TaxID=116603 RepID=A0A9P7DPH1_9AGAM|nr:uncharacterized protein HD556DRAFT_1525052 [Suillus plorans]KAG1799755.1 hypothetical protein HD556DRAFT_1525052 [Suillus plorans]
MTLLLNDPSLWPLISSYRISSYFIVVASTGVMYDWVLTFGLEVELVWKQRWSLITVLFLSVRYLGISYAVLSVLLDWIAMVVTAMLGLIMLVRLYAMYQQSRKVLISLVVIFVPAIVFVVVASAMTMRNISAEEAILFGNYQCTSDYKGDYLLLTSITWILGTVWEVLALFLAVWIAVKHFRELQRHSAGGIIDDCFTVLMKTHVVYFASVVGVSCLGLGTFFSTILAEPNSMQAYIYFGFLLVFRSVQMFVLGPRLILGVREYHAKLTTDFDPANGMDSIAFQEGVHVSTSSSV